MDQSSEELNVLALSRELGVKRPTLENWIAALEDSFLVQRLPGLETSELRRLRHAKLHATDPGLVAAFASSADPLGDSRVLGRILEAAVLRHLREVARNADGKVMYVQLHSSSGSKRGEVDFLLLTAGEAFFVEVTGSPAGPEKTKGLLAHVAAYRGHRKKRSQLGGRQTFALAVTGETFEADGQASAARFLDRVLETQIDDPCQALRAMSVEVAR
jgi:predicted AAA+ superfamily ATPase